MLLPDLELKIPESHHDWTHDDYAADMIRNTGKAWGTVIKGEVQETLAETILIGLEWTRRNDWEFNPHSGLNLQWNNSRGLSYLVVRVADGIAQAHMYAIQGNHIRAAEFLNHASAHVVDYFEAQKWPFLEVVNRVLQHR